MTHFRWIIHSSLSLFSYHTNSRQQKLFKKLHFLQNTVNYNDIFNVSIAMVAVPTSESRPTEGGTGLTPAPTPAEK